MLTPLFYPPPQRSLEPNTRQPGFSPSDSADRGGGQAESGMAKGSQSPGNRNWNYSSMIQSQLASENPGMPHPNPRSLRLVLKLAGSGICKLGGRQIFVPLLPFFSRCPRDCLQQTGTLVTREEPKRPG